MPKRSSRGEAASSGTAADALQNLLRIETTLQAQLSDARARAAAIVAQAKLDADARHASIDAESRAAVATFEASEGARVDAECQAIDARAAATVDAIDAVTDATVQELARFVVSRLLHSDVPAESGALNP